MLARKPTMLGRERPPQRAAVVGLAVADGAVVRDIADPPRGGGGGEEREAEAGCSPHDHAWVEANAATVHSK